MNITDLLASTSYVVFNKHLAKELGLNETIILGELLTEYNYWLNRGELVNGMFFSTVENVENETTLNDYYQRAALKHLQEEGLLEVKQLGMPSKRYIKLNLDIIKNKMLTDLNPSSQQIKDKNSTDLNPSSLKFKELELNRFETNNNNNNNKATTIAKAIVADAPSSSHSSNPSENNYLNEGFDGEENQGSFKKKGNQKDYVATAEGFGEVKDSSKGYKSLMSYINGLSYPDDIKDELKKWYEALGKGRVSIGQLKDKLKDLYENTSGNFDDIKESIHKAYINSWMAFYKPKQDYKHDGVTSGISCESEIERRDRLGLSRRSGNMFWVSKQEIRDKMYKENLTEDEAKKALLKELKEKEKKINELNAG